MNNDICNILVVDDEEGVRFILDHYLSGQGYQVTLSEGICEAEQSIKSKQFDVALIDQFLSNGQNGLDLLQTIHRQQPYCRTILMSGWPTFDSAATAMRYKVFTYLTKPMKEELILETVAEAAKQAQRERLIGEHISYLNTLFYDLSEPESVEQTLIKLQNIENVSALASGIAHDFNNILAIVKGHTELMQDDIPSDNPARESLDAISQALAYAKKLTNQLLPDGASEAAGSIVVEMASVVEAVLKLVQASLPGNIHIKTNIENAPLKVHGHPNLLQQAVVNICVNAIQAMKPEGGSLNITLSKEKEDGQSQGACLRLVINDTGPGISPEIMDKLFAPFFTTKSSEQGTGLGLFVTEKIIKKNHGTIAVESQFGQGTTFVVRLPLAKEQKG